MKVSTAAVLCFVLASLLTLTGCENTVQGLGKDMEKNGEAIQKSV